MSLLAIVLVLTVAVVGRIFILLPVLNLFLLTPYLFISNKSMKRCMDTPNLYRYRMCFNNFISIYRKQITSLTGPYPEPISSLFSVSIQRFGDYLCDDYLSSWGGRDSLGSVWYKLILTRLIAREVIIYVESILYFCTSIPCFSNIRYIFIRPCTPAFQVVFSLETTNSKFWMLFWCSKCVLRLLLMCSCWFNCFNSIREGLELWNSYNSSSPLLLRLS